MESIMPYDRINDLPESIQSSLLVDAQKIYRAAFNSAWDEYRTKNSRNNEEDSREEVCHKVAWSAVKKNTTKIVKANRLASKPEPVVNLMDQLYGISCFKDADVNSSNQCNGSF